jgi:hypothetical protein
MPYVQGRSIWLGDLGRELFLAGDFKDCGDKYLMSFL